MNELHAKRVLIISMTLMVVLVTAQTSRNAPSKSLGENSVKFPAVAMSLGSQRRDFRRAFFGNAKALETAMKNGSFLLSYGGSDKAMMISTNDCATVQAALNNYAGGLTNLPRQIRLVKQDVIWQTPVPRKGDIEALEAFVAQRFQAGDVLILTAVE